MTTTENKTPRARKSTAAGRKPRTTRRATTAQPAAEAVETQVDSETTAPQEAPAAAPEDSAPEAPAPAETSATETVSGDDQEAGKADRFRRQDLIQAVADRCSVKRSDAKEVLNLVLEEIGKALDEGDELVLQPLGKLSVKQRREATNGTNLTVKIRRNAPTAASDGETPLAEPEADS